MNTAMYPLTTTTARIYACHELRDRAAESLGITEPSDEQISYERLLDSLGLDDALLFCRAAPELAPIWRRYAVWCVKEVRHLLTDQRSVAALDVAERHANGQATDEELAAARAAADDARDDERAAADDARAAAWAAADDARDDERAAAEAAGATWAAAAAARASAWAAWAAAWAAADDAGATWAAAAAARASAHAVWAAADAADAAGGAGAARAAARRHQSDAFRQLVTTGMLP